MSISKDFFTLKNKHIAPCVSDAGPVVVGKRRTKTPLWMSLSYPASFIPQEFLYCGTKFFFHMALRLKDPEVFSHFYWSHFEIWHLKKFTICLYNYYGKHTFLMKHDAKSRYISEWKIKFDGRTSK